MMMDEQGLPLHITPEKYKVLKDLIDADVLKKIEEFELRLRAAENSIEKMEKEVKHKWLF